MEIRILRFPSEKGATLGVMEVDNAFQCYTLEDEVREPEHVSPVEPMQHIAVKSSAWVASWKVPGKTAIPRGRYCVVVDMSERFKRLMLHVLNVPGFLGIRVHSGNTAADTEGCILVGQTKEANLIYKSRAALDALFPKVQAALAAGEEVWLTIA